MHSITSPAFSCIVFYLLDSPVLVHGDNGMDMTLVLTSLTQILLDPECRTITGYVTSGDF